MKSSLRPTRLGLLVSFSFFLGLGGCKDDKPKNDNPPPPPPTVSSAKAGGCAGP